MHEALQFETPENIRVQYTPAGLGTRFVAWFIDQILVSLLMLAIGGGLVRSSQPRLGVAATGERGKRLRTSAPRRGPGERR